MCITTYLYCYIDLDFGVCECSILEFVSALLAIKSLKSSAIIFEILHAWVLVWQWSGYLHTCVSMEMDALIG